VRGGGSGYWMFTTPHEDAERPVHPFTHAGWPPVHRWTTNLTYFPNGGSPLRRFQKNTACCAPSDAQTVFAFERSGSGLHMQYVGR
jgi:hypothetical protein